MERKGTAERPWSSSALAKLAWPEHPNYGGGAPWARTVLGSAIHTFLERRYSGESEKPLTDLYHSAVAEQHEVRYGREQTADTMIALGESILEACLSDTDMFAVGVVGCEMSFELSLDVGGTTQYYDGTVDLVTRDSDGGLHLIDYKTGGRFDPAIYVGQAHPQPHLYAVAARYGRRWGTGTRYVQGHVLDWSRATPIAPLWQWPSFTFLHLTEGGVKPIHAITPGIHSTRASVALIRDYTRAALAAL